jgi:hypothetical protein
LSFREILTLSIQIWQESSKERYLVSRATFQDKTYREDRRVNLFQKKPLPDGVNFMKFLIPKHYSRLRILPWTKMNRISPKISAKWKKIAHFWLGNMEG